MQLAIKPAAGRSDDGRVGVADRVGIPVLVVGRGRHGALSLSRSLSPAALSPMSFVEDMFVNPAVVNASFAQCVTDAAMAAAKAGANTSQVLAEMLGECEDADEGKLPAGGYGVFQLLFLMVSQHHHTLHIRRLE